MTLADSPTDSRKGTRFRWLDRGIPDTFDRVSGTMFLAVGVHLAASAVHGLTHGLIPVRIPGWQYGVGAIVLFVLPIVGATLILREWATAGATVLLLSGVAAVAFEGGLHFLVVNPDHVSTVTTHGSAFAGTAALSTVGNILLILAGGWSYYRIERAPDSDRDSL